MARALFERVIQDTDGDVQANVSVELREVDGTTPLAQSLFAAESGGSPLGSNILTSDANGRVAAYAPLAQRLVARINSTNYPGEIWPDPANITTLDATQTLTNKTLTSPTITGATMTSPSITGGIFRGDVYTNGLLLRPEQYGAVADWQHFGGASMSSVTNTTRLTLSVAPPIALAVGMTICVQGAGAAGADLITTIASVTSTTVFVLNTACQTTVAGAAWEAGTDSTTPLNNWWQALLASPGYTGELGGGTYMAGNLDWTEGHGVCVRGFNFPGFGADNPLNRGSFLMAKPGLTGKWIDISGGSHVLFEGFGVGRSDQADWSVTPTVAFYCSSLDGIETTNFTFRDMYISGTYSVSTFYFNQMFEISMTRVFAYNYHRGTGRVLTLTANNRDNLESDLGNTQHGVASFISSGQFRAYDCQFNHVGSAVSGYDPATERTGFAVDFDSWLDALFVGCLFICGNRACRIKDESASANEQTRALTFINPTFENPGQTGNMAMRGAFFLDSNVITEDVTIINPYFGLTDTTPANAAWVEDGAAAGTTTALKKWTILGSKSVLGGETALIINKTDSGATSRLTYCKLDLHARGCTISGTMDQTNEITDEGTLSISGSGAESRSWGWTSAGPAARYGLIIGSRGLLSTAGTQILGTTNVASAISNLVVTNAASGNAPSLSVNSSASDVDLNITAKGTGNVRLTTSAIVAGASSNLGFFASGGTTKQTITGSKGANAALTSLLTALAAHGLITDSTS